MTLISAAASRRVAIAFLALAGGMLLWGETVLASRLSGKTFIIYWTLCFLFTGCALIFSLIEIFHLHRRLYRQQKDLLLKTLEQIRRDQASRKEDQPPPSAAT